MKIHGAAAMAILVLLGTLLNGHVKFAWMAHRNRINGVLVLATFAILTLTGYGLYYSGSEKLRTWTSWVHLWVGLFLPILLVLHIWLGRRTRLPSELLGGSATLAAEFNDRKRENSSGASVK